jgi:malate dehydrogenase
MRSVAIIGAGEIGGSTAGALAGRDWLKRIVLIDACESVAAGKALDIQQSGAVSGFDTRVTGATDVSAAAGCDVLVVADRHAGGEWTDDAALDVVRRALPVVSKAPIVFAGASQLRLLRLAISELRVPQARVLGSAPHALGSAARAMVAVVADRSATDVQIAVVGVPGAWVPAWESACLGGLPLSSVLPAPRILAADRLIRGSWPPGPYALGSAAADCVAAMHSASARRLVVFAGDPDALGPRPVAAVPARLGPAGIVGVDRPVLSARERVAFESALELA